MSWHQLKAKYANNCYECKKYFNQGTLIFWDYYTHKVKHVKCLEVKPKFSKTALVFENVLDTKTLQENRRIQSSKNIPTFQYRSVNDVYDSDYFQQQKEKREALRD